MNSLELLSKWPGWKNKSADELIASPAWAMQVRWGDDEMFMRASDNRPRDMIALKIAFDDEEHFLGIGNREAFPNLNKLWSEKQNLPPMLVLALVEKECGKLLQMLENAVRRQLKVIGLTSAEERDGTSGFDVVDSAGNIVASIALTLSRTVKESFGDIGNINTAHPTVREMTRPAVAEYAAFELSADSKAFQPGDYLLIPEADNPSSPKWIVGDGTKDSKFHVRASEETMISFAEFAYDNLPAVPSPAALELFHQGVKVAAGRFERVGRQPAFAIEEVL